MSEKNVFFLVLFILFLVSFLGFASFYFSYKLFKSFETAYNMNYSNNETNTDLNISNIGEENSNVDIVTEIYESASDKYSNEYLNSGKWKYIDGRQVYTNELLDLKLTAPERAFITIPQEGIIEILETTEDHKLVHNYVKVRVVKGSVSDALEAEKTYYTSTYTVNDMIEGTDEIDGQKLSSLKIDSYGKNYYKSVDDGLNTLVFQVTDDSISTFELNKIVSWYDSNPVIEDTSKSIFDEGIWNNNVYQNKYLGLNINIPKDWNYKDFTDSGVMSLYGVSGEEVVIHISTFNDFNIEKYRNDYEILEKFSANIAGKDYDGLNFYNDWDDKNGPISKLYYSDLSNGDYYITINTSNISKNDISILGKIFTDGNNTSYTETAKPLEERYVFMAAKVEENKYINDYLGFSTKISKGWKQTLSPSGKEIDIDTGVSGHTSTMTIEINEGIYKAEVEMEKKKEHLFATYGNDMSYSSGTKTIDGVDFYYVEISRESSEYGEGYVETFYYKNVHNDDYLLKIRNSVYFNEEFKPLNYNIGDIISFNKNI